MEKKKKRIDCFISENKRIFAMTQPSVIASERSERGNLILTEAGMRLFQMSQEL